MSMLKNPLQKISEHKSGSRRIVHINKEKSRVKQSFKTESDINNIVKRYNPKLLLQQMVDPNAYGDFSAITDLHSAKNLIIEAEEKFLTLPSKVRKAFDNDPQKLIDAFNDPNSKKILQDLGLLPAPNKVEPTPSPEVGAAKKPTEPEPKPTE